MQNPLFKTTNQSYSPYWELNGKQTINDENIPTFTEINNKIPLLKSAEITLKKQLQDEQKTDFISD